MKSSLYADVSLGYLSHPVFITSSPVSDICSYSCLDVLLFLQTQQVGLPCFQHPCVTRRGFI